MGAPKCWRCGKGISGAAKPTSCALIAVGGPPSNWDIERYACEVSLTSPLIDEAIYPRRMIPFGRTEDGSACTLVAHTACYRLLNGVVGAARKDPERAAAFERDHPSQRFTRQAAAAGVPEPIGEPARDYGEAQERQSLTAAQRAASLGDEMGAEPTLADLDLGGAFIGLVNRELLSTVAATPSSKCGSHSAAQAAEAATQGGRSDTI